MIIRKIKLFQLFQKIVFKIPVIIFIHPEIAPLARNLDAQSLTYKSILPVFSKQEWNTGTAVLGDNPIMIPHNGTSSNYGKSTLEIIFNRFKDITFDK